MFITIIRQSKYKSLAEYKKDIDACKAHYKYFAEYKTRWIFFETKDDYMKYIIMHDKKYLISYGSV
jgi:hypothetical protein